MRRVVFPVGVLSGILGSALVTLAFAQVAPPAPGRPAIGFLNLGPASNLSGVEPNVRSLRRYEKTFMAGFTEYFPGDCSPVSSGDWIITSPPEHGEATKDFVDGPLDACPGKTFTFAVLYYKWTLHSNKFVTDQFNATYKTPDNRFNLPFVFDISVPVVRPIGETSVFTGWADSRANWMQTLKPPSDDPDFDFSGEEVREKYVSVKGNCRDKTGKGSMGSTPYSKEALPWAVREGNIWEPDQVGLGPCPVEFYRCVKSTPCKYTLTQQMQIRAPVDKDFTTYTINTLSGGVDGSILPLLSNKIGVGNVTSKRGDGAEVQKGFTSSSRNCPANAKLPC